LFPNNDAVFQHDDTHSQKCSVLVWGAWRCTSTSSLASTIAQLKYHRTTVVSFREQSEKQIQSIISEATRRVVQYSARDCSDLTWVYSKKDTSCVTGKWWSNAILIQKCVSFTAASIVFVHPLYMLQRYIPWGDKINYVKMYLCKQVFCLIACLICLCSVMLLNGFVLLTCFHHNHFLLHSTHILMRHWWLSNLMGKILLVSCQRSKRVDVHH